MTGWLGVAVYCVAVVALVLALARFAEWAVTFWEDREESRRARSVFPPAEPWVPDLDSLDFELHSEQAMRVANGGDR